MGEAWIGIGIIFGPNFGGTLYSLGGFWLPTAAAAIVMFPLAVYTCFWRKARLKRQSGNSGSDASLLGEAEERLHLPDHAVYFCAIVLLVFDGFLSGALGPILSAHWVNYCGWSEPVVGGIWGVSGLTYVVFAFFMGKFVDRGTCYPRVIFAIAPFLNIVIMLMLSWRYDQCVHGVHGWYQMPSIVAVGGPILFGVSEALAVIPFLTLLGQSAPWDLPGLNASLLNGCLGFGMAMGPLLFFPLVEKLGFPSVAIFFAALTLVLGCITTLIFAVRPRPSARSVLCTAEAA